MSTEALALMLVAGIAIGAMMIVAVPLIFAERRRYGYGLIGLLAGVALPVVIGIGGAFVLDLMGQPLGQSWAKGLGQSLGLSAFGFGVVGWRAGVKRASRDRATPRS